MASQPLITLATLTFAAMAVLMTNQCMAAPTTTTTTKAPQAMATSGDAGSDSGIIIGGSYGLRSKGRRRVRSGDQEAAAATNSLTELLGGKRRRNRGFKRLIKSRGGVGALGDAVPEDLGLPLPSLDVDEDIEELDTEEIARRIGALAQANERTLAEAQAEADANRNSRMRNAARRYFGGVGRNFMTARPTQLGEGLSRTIENMADGVNNVLRNLPMEELGASALRLAGYFQRLIDSGVPSNLINSLLTTRAGDAQATMRAFLEAQGEPLKLEPLLEDVAANYRRFFTDTADEFENFIATLLPGIQIPDSIFPNMGDDGDDNNDEVEEEEDLNDNDGGEAEGIAVGEINPNMEDDEPAGIAVGEIKPNTEDPPSVAVGETNPSMEDLLGVAVGEINPNAVE